MFNGKILTGTRKTIPGTYKQHAYQDVWQESMDIQYDGELTEEIRAAICTAFRRSKHYTGGGSSFGALRWNSADSVHVDADKRQLIINKSVNLTD